MLYIGEETDFRIGDSIAGHDDTERLRRTLAVTGEFAGVALIMYDTQTPFRKYPPLSEEDANGYICAKCKMWHPASKTVKIGGVPIGVDFAHEKEGEVI